METTKEIAKSALFMVAYGVVIRVGLGVALTVAEKLEQRKKNPDNDVIKAKLIEMKYDFTMF